MNEHFQPIEEPPLTEGEQAALGRLETLRRQFNSSNITRDVDQIYSSPEVQTELNANKIATGGLSRLARRHIETVKRPDLFGSCGDDTAAETTIPVIKDR
jgi:hypothetical protein